MSFSEGKYVKFTPYGRSESGKTAIWKVQAKADGVILGTIKWFGSWRCYSFFVSRDDIPIGGELVYEKQCMRDIAQFCESQTQQHRQGGIQA